MIIAGNSNKARDVGKFPGPRFYSHTKADGTIATERLPRNPFLDLVDLQGNVVQESLHNGGGNDGAEEVYRMFIERLARRRGLVPANACPQLEGVEVKRRLPPELLGKPPCSTTTTGKVANHGGRFPHGHHCSCIAALIESRRAAHAKTEGSRKSAAEILTELNRKVAASQVDSNDRLATAIERLTEMGVKAPATAPTAKGRGKASETGEE